MRHDSLYIEPCTAELRAGGSSPILPDYARDGRALVWNDDRTAVSFSSTNEEYHSDKVAVSSSMLKVLDRSPAHLQATLSAQQKPKKAFLMGNALHAAVLEPVLFSKEFCVYPGSRVGNNAKWQAFKGVNSTKGILNQADHDSVRASAFSARNTVVIRNAKRSFTLADLVAHGQVEQNIYWVDKPTGLTCRMRYDLLVQNVLIDLKSTQDARESVFSRDAMKFNYHLQMAFYIEGLNVFRPQSASRHTAILIAVEKVAPYAVAVHKLDWTGFLDVGHARMRDLLGQYRNCVTTNCWPAYVEPVGTLKLPQWYLHDQMLRSDGLVKTSNRFNG